jgi:hypothetical protein
MNRVRCFRLTKAVAMPLLESVHHFLPFLRMGFYSASARSRQNREMGRPRKEWPRPEPVQIELNGKVYSGTYTVTRDGTVRVSYGFRSTSAHNGSISPQHYAKFLLGELIPESDDKRGVQGSKKDPS